MPEIRAKVAAVEAHTETPYSVRYYLAPASVACSAPTTGMTPVERPPEAEVIFSAEPGRSYTVIAEAEFKAGPPRRACATGVRVGGGTVTLPWVKR